MEVNAYPQSLVGPCPSEVGWINFRHVPTPGPLTLAREFQCLGWAQTNSNPGVHLSSSRINQNRNLLGRRKGKLFCIDDGQHPLQKC